jgi:hypothetical protein
MMYQQAYDLTLIGALLITIGMMGVFLVAQCVALDALKQNLHNAHTMLKLAEQDTKHPYYSNLQKLKSKQS